jgi:hypothetical protein
MNWWGRRWYSSRKKKKEEKVSATNRYTGETLAVAGLLFSHNLECASHARAPLPSRTSTPLSNSGQKEWRIHVAKQKKNKNTQNRKYILSGLVRGGNVCFKSLFSLLSFLSCNVPAPATAVPTHTAK